MAGLRFSWIWHASELATSWALEHDETLLYSASSTTWKCWLPRAAIGENSVQPLRLTSMEWSSSELTIVSNVVRDAFQYYVYSD